MFLEEPGIETTRCLLWSMKEKSYMKCKLQSADS